MDKFLMVIFSIFIVNSTQAQIANKAVRFKGTVNSKATFDNINQLKSGGKFTFEAWIQIEKWNNDSYIFKQDNGKNPISVQLKSGTNNTLSFQMVDMGKTASASAIPITLGNWHHIAVVYDGAKNTNKRLDFYIDKKLQPITYINAPTKSESMVANNFELATNKFEGKLDEVRIWDKALNIDELDFQNTINNRHPLIKNLVAYWKMDDNNLIITDNKGKNNGVLRDADLIAVTDNKNFVYRIVSSYIRSNFYESNQITEEAILNNNDIVYMAANVVANGDLFHEFPINDGKLFNAKYLSSFKGRNGVIQFNGQNSSMNAGKGLLTKADTSCKSFTFSTWIYIDEWVEQSYIFRKNKDELNKVDIQLGSAKNEILYIHLANGLNTYVEIKSGLNSGAWHHLSVAYNGAIPNGNNLRIYIDGIIKPWDKSSIILPKTLPFFDSDFELGVNFKGKMDETSINQIALTEQEILSNIKTPLIINSWSSTKTIAYWKFDDATNPGKDSRSWVGVLDGLKHTLKNKDGAKLRLGIIQGDWKKMASSPISIANFVSNVKELVIKYNFDGVDLDFEWCYTPQQWLNYSNVIIALKTALPKNSIFSVTLHPLFYQITSEAIAATDFISIQSYGPSPARYPYAEFVENINTLINYGFPKNKLVMGLPFYAVASDNSKITTPYRTIVNQNLSLNASSDEENVLMGSKILRMTFNGQETIIKKAKLIRDKDLLGVMYWDLATDVDLNHNLSLLQGLNSVINANLSDKTSLKTQK